ncbi:ATP-binding protein [Paraflavitalea sp. CAU 1676]|uniref:ATP-binding protein n=1 Tax=Paraflavitalea sp. CAU 1676 TaxID=3032598 RepID=UPI0023DAAF85|nr:ATP-binding protein [Paraflavitalea sp. CAU 1676]MDF2193339.1 ATP-binding protein [Paraflavitalea sp. CAU 1676]
MKKTLAAIFCLITAGAQAQSHSLEKIWETDSIVAVPESALLLPKQNKVLVSLIDGAPWEADGKGGIGVLSTNGKDYDSSWVMGLHCPKGMGAFKGKLYVADYTSVVVIDINGGKIEQRITHDSARGFNDITISDKGVVYVSDSKSFKVWKVENGVLNLYLENLPGLNGLKAVGNDLIIGSGKSFLKANAQKEITKIADLPQGADGIEPIGNGDYLVTAWAGYIFYVQADGKVETLLDTHLEKRNTADIGYDPVKKIVYVPTFFAKTIAAYQLK